MPRTKYDQRQEDLLRHWVRIGIAVYDLGDGAWSFTKAFREKHDMLCLYLGWIFYPNGRTKTRPLDSWERDLFKAAGLDTNGRKIANP
jgi:hypothetical protein